jgi:ankyrin repeat protein
VDSCDIWGWTPLHKASQSGHVEVSRVLIDHGANVNARERYHYAPIHFSSENGHLGIAKLLLERGADVNALNCHGQTPYQTSVVWGHREVADLLREHGAGRARLDPFMTQIRCLTGASILIISDSTA